MVWFRWERGGGTTGRLDYDTPRRKETPPTVTPSLKLVSAVTLEYGPIPAGSNYVVCPSSHTTIATY